MYREFEGDLLLPNSELLHYFILGRAFDLNNGATRCLVERFLLAWLQLALYLLARCLPADAVE